MGFDVWVGYKVDAGGSVRSWQEKKFRVKQARQVNVERVGAVVSASVYDDEQNLLGYFCGPEIQVIVLPATTDDDGEEE